jgi:hypothetical protein
MMAMIFRLVGVSVLLWAAVRLGLRERESCLAERQTVRAWRAFLFSTRHRILHAGIPVAHLLEELRRDGATWCALGGERDTPLYEDACGAFCALCRRGGEGLPADHPAATELSSLGERICEAVSCEQVGEQIDRVLESLAALEEELEEQLAGPCRARLVLFVCGALCAVLMLW